MSSGERRICRQVDQHWTSRLPRKTPPTPATTRRRPCRRRRFHWCHSSSSSSSRVPDRTTTSSRRRCHTNGYPQRDCRANRTTIGTILISTTITTTIERNQMIIDARFGTSRRKKNKYVRSSIFERMERQKTKH